MTTENAVDHEPLVLVRGLLYGQTVVVMGGEERKAHTDRLFQAFKLKNLLWVPTRQSDASSRRFAHVITHKGIVLAVTLHGLLRHQHTHDLRALCKRWNVPMVAYWRSPNPHGLAAAIISQHLVDSIRVKRST